MSAHPDLPSQISQVEACVVALQASLRQQSVAGTEAQARQLHLSLAQTVHALAAGATDGLPEPLHRRLSGVGAQIARAREHLARTTASLDRAVATLLPDAIPRSLYSAQGLPAGSRRNAAIVV